MVAAVVLVALGMKATLAHVGDPLAWETGTALVGGTSLYLLGQVAFKWRTLGALGVPLWTIGRWLWLGGSAVWDTVEIGAALGQTIGLAAVAALVGDWDGVGPRLLVDQLAREPEGLAASLRLTRMLQGRHGITTRNVIGHNENRSSPFHRERVDRLRSQTHGDFPTAAMDVYRRRLARLPAPASISALWSSPGYCVVYSCVPPKRHVRCPHTAPSTETELIEADDLARYTGASGVLTRQLRVRGYHRALAEADDVVVRPVRATPRPSVRTNGRQFVAGPVHVIPQPFGPRRES